MLARYSANLFARPLPGDTGTTQSTYDFLTRAFRFNTLALAGSVGDLSSMSKSSTPQRRQAPPSWTEALDRGRADIAAGRTEDAEALLRRLEREDARITATTDEQRRAG